jgi:hypothetical protein
MAEVHRLRPLLAPPSPAPVRGVAVRPAVHVTLASCGVLRLPLRAGRTDGRRVRAVRVRRARRALDFYILPCFPPYALDTLGARLAGIAVGTALLAVADRLLWPEPAPSHVAARIADTAGRVAAYARALAPRLRDGRSNGSDDLGAEAEAAAEGLRLRDRGRGRRALPLRPGPPCGRAPPRTPRRPRPAGRRAAPRVRPALAAAGRGTARPRCRAPSPAPCRTVHRAGPSPAVCLGPPSRQPHRRRLLRREPVPPSSVRRSQHHYANRDYGEQRRVMDRVTRARRRPDRPRRRGTDSDALTQVHGPPQAGSSPTRSGSNPADPRDP